MVNVANAAIARGEQSSHRQILDALIKDLGVAEVLIITTLPRGGLQIVQPQKVAEPFVRAYGREFHGEDEVSWRAMTTGTVVKGNASKRYSSEFLKSFGFQYVAAAPLSSPILDGYPGALQILRDAEQGDFSDADLKALSDVAKKLDSAFAATHASRAGTEDGSPAWIRRPSTRVVIFDGEGKVRAFESAFDQFDDRIRQQMKQDVKQRLSRKAAEPITVDRILLPDAAGDHETFNSVVYQSYPAMGNGPFVFVCMLPTGPEWSTVRPADFQADAELARLIPAMKFMQQEYHRGPTLVEIAKTLQLSPFHFHRRFTELLGLTPKHFLLECQIHESKLQLISGEKELAQIASDCGFAHQSHFTSRFKQATGLTPTRWRRMARDRKNGGGESVGE